VEGVKFAFQVVACVVLASLAASAQVVEFNGIEFRAPRNQLVPVLHENFRGAIKCADSTPNATVELTRLADFRQPILQKQQNLSMRSDESGRFQFARVTAGYWNLTVHSDCDGIKREMTQVIRVSATVFSDCSDREIVMDINAGQGFLKSREKEACF
jgi:hypothetical protein